MRDRMRVSLIPTGVMELEGLAASLDALFGGRHDFVCVPKIPGRPGDYAKPFSGFTSNGVAPESAEISDSPVRLLVEALAQEVYPRRRRGRQSGDPADLAIVIDDLELENEGDHGSVSQTFRSAIERHIESARDPTDRADLRACLRHHASFHLAVAMAESWFFADPKGMERNGVPVDRCTRTLPGIDPERFETDDPDYLADDGSACEEILRAVANPRKKPQYSKAPWIMEPDARFPFRDRAHHPKHYLEWLCRAPKDKRCTAWRERETGAVALAALDWNAVISNPSHCAYARVFLEDIADALGEHLAQPDAALRAEAVRLRPTRDVTAVLRNL
jgi:hypothetical protein